MTEPQSRFTPDELIRLVKEAGEQLMQLATEIERTFEAANAIRRGQLSLIDHGAERAERAGVPAERIVTTWDLPRLREWTSRSR